MKSAGATSLETGVGFALRWRGCRRPSNTRKINPSSPVLLVYAAGPGTRTSSSVPAPYLLETSSLPPMRRARSRMPIMPQWPSRCSVPQYIRHDAAAVVPAMKAEAFRSIYEVQNDVGCASVTDRVGECFTPDPVKLVAYGCAKWLRFSGDGFRDCASVSFKSFPIPAFEYSHGLTSSYLQK